MSIVDPNSVLIIGAGASTQFGLPLGEKLLTGIVKQLSSDLTLINRQSLKQHFAALTFNLAQHLPSRLEQAPIIHSKYFSLLGDDAFKGHTNVNRDKYNGAINEIKTDIERFKLLKTLLENQTADTIDDFIAQNPKVGDLAKFCVGYKFFEKLYTYNKQHMFKLRTLEQRYLQDQRNWIHLLINLIRQGVRDKKVSAENPIHIISFNYDNIIEHVLEKQFSNTEMSLPNWKDIVKVYHVHGHMKHLPETTDSPFQLCKEWADSITVIHEENVPNEITQTRQQAKKLIFDAHSIYVCGFAFSGANVRMLNLDQPSSKNIQRQIYYCNYANNIGLTRTVDNLSRNERRYIVNPVVGTKDNPMKITDWFYTEMPGELPS